MSPRALELRIHGVNNTPPSAMLALPEHAVEQFRGDKFGSFWRPKPDKVAELHEDHAGKPRDDVQREAYSWGGMSRSTPGAPGSGVASVVANVLGRVGWALLLPFGLANVAYWSRALPTGEMREIGPPAKDAATAEPDEPTRWWDPRSWDPRSWWWNNGRGAASTRLFGLGLTILLVLSVCAAVIDLWAIQCSLEGNTCRKLPEWLDIVGTPESHARVLAASAVPVLLLIGLLLLTSLSRSRYEMTTARKDPSDRPGVLLAGKDMWQGSPRLRRLTRLHLAAGFSVVTLVTSIELAGERKLFHVITVLAFVLLGTVAVRVVVTAADCPDITKGAPGGVWSWGLVVSATILLAVHAVALHIVKPDFTEPLRVTTWGPPVVTAALLGIALSAWSWRKWTNAGPLALGTALVVLLILSRELSVTAIAAAATGLVLIALALRGKSEWQAWRGMGPGVLLGLSLAASTLLSTVLVLTTRSWLGNIKPDEMLMEKQTALDFYQLFSGSFTVALALLVALIVLLAVPLLVRLFWPLRFMLGHTPSERRELVARWRHVIATAHRAEAVVGVLSALSTLAIALTVYLSFDFPSSLASKWPKLVIDQGVLVTGLAGLSLIASFVGAGLLANRRPLGLLWDLMCFLPRTAHPYAPPCYAERAVPELADRVREWLDTENPDEPNEKREVVLSAHSLGAVLAVAAIYALPDGYANQVKLLTYGVQLRPYFGRIFPELLGPDILGTTRCRRGKLWARDPWGNADDVIQYPDPGSVIPYPKPDSVAALMQGRWHNLWRRTDYLGFPVVSWNTPTDTSVDRWADETNGSPDKVETHSDYHRCVAYKAAFERLVPEL